MKSKNKRKKSLPPPGNPMPNIHWDGYVFHMDGEGKGNIIFIPYPICKYIILPYDIVGDFNADGYAAVAKKEIFNGQEKLKYGLVCFSEEGKNIDQSFLTPCADEFRLMSQKCEFVFSNANETITLNLRKVELPIFSQNSSKVTDDPNAIIAVGLSNNP